MTMQHSSIHFAKIAAVAIDPAFAQARIHPSAPIAWLRAHRPPERERS
jgi:hypothetical protein